MIRGEVRDSRARRARRSARAAARALAGAAVAAVGGLAVSLAAAGIPALAAQHPGGPWVRIAAGGDHTCGIRAGGTLWCWGDNSERQLGIGNYPSPAQPQQVTTPAASGWASVTVGGVSTCGIRTGGTLWCWGDNSDGQLGLGNHTAQDRPRQVTGCVQPAAQPRPTSTPTTARIVNQAE
jgi:hypothetical protein